MATPKLLEKTVAEFQTQVDKLSNEITKAESDLRERLKDKYAERQELQDAIARITGRGSRAPARRRPTSAGPRAGRGKNQQAILSALDSGPMSPIDISDRTGIARNVTYNTLSRMAEQGTVVKTDAGGGRVAYKKA